VGRVRKPSLWGKVVRLQVEQVVRDVALAEAPEALADGDVALPTIEGFSVRTGEQVLVAPAQTPAPTLAGDATAAENDRRVRQRNARRHFWMRQAMWQLMYGHHVRYGYGHGYGGIGHGHYGAYGARKRYGGMGRRTVARRSVRQRRR